MIHLLQIVLEASWLSWITENWAFIVPPLVGIFYEIFSRRIPTKKSISIWNAIKTLLLLAIDLIDRVLNKLVEDKIKEGGESAGNSSKQ